MRVARAETARPRIEEREPSRSRRANQEEPERRPSRKVRVRETASSQVPGRSERDAEKTPQERRGSGVYRVHLGRFRDRGSANRLRDEVVTKTGNNAFLVPVEGGYRVQVGSYRQRENADKIADALRSHKLRARVSED